MRRQTKEDREEFRRLYIKLDPGVRTRGTHVGGGTHADIGATFDAAMRNNTHDLKRLLTMAEADSLLALDKRRITNGERDFIDAEQETLRVEE